jgi:hypothetical protein
VTPTARRVCASLAALTAAALVLGPWLVIVATGAGLAVAAVLEREGWLTW